MAYARRRTNPTLQRSAVKPAAANNKASAARQPSPGDILTVNPGDLAADTMRVTNRISANSRCIALGDDGTVWTGEIDGSIVIRLPPFGAELARVPAEKPLNGWPPQVTVLQRVGEQMWATYSNGTIKVFATQPTPNGDIHKITENHQLTNAIYAVCDLGKYVYTAGGDWKVYMWDTEDYHFERQMYGHKNTVRALAAYVDPESGEERVVSGGDDGTIKIWNPRAPPQKDNDTACVATILTPKKCAVWSLAVMEDTAELWAGCEDGMIRVYDLYSKCCSAVVEGHTSPVTALRQIDHNVWSAGKNGTLIVTARYTKEVVNVVKQPAASTSNTAGGLRFSPCIQPVQRTIVNNVWVTNTEGSWQCWSQLSPETVPYSGQRRDQRDSAPSDVPSTAVPRGNDTAPRITNATNALVTTAPALSKHEELADKVANLRRTVQALEQEPRPPSDPQSEPEIYESGDDEDEDERLDKVEEALRRDHMEAEDA